MIRSFVALCLFVAIAACTSSADLNEPPVPLGDFRLGHNVVIAPKVVKGPGSRGVSDEVLTKSLEDAIDARFRRYDGAGQYHFGVSVEGYVLAVPGIPIVLSPKSVLIIRLTVWDNATQTKLNPEAEQLTVLETVSGSTLIGSGLTQSKEVQLQNLTQNMAKSIERFLVRKQAEEGWFTPKAQTLPAPLSQDG